MLYRTQLLKDDQVRYNVHLAHLQQDDFSHGATRREFYRFMGTVERCEWKQSAYFLKKYRPLFEAAVPTWKATGDFRRRGPGHGKTGTVSARGVDGVTEGEEDEDELEYESGESDDESRAGPSRRNGRMQVVHTKGKGKGRQDGERPHDDERHHRAAGVQARKRFRQESVEFKAEVAATGLQTPSTDHEDHRRPSRLSPSDVLVVGSSEEDEPPTPAPNPLIKRPRRTGSHETTNTRPVIPSTPTAHAIYGSLSPDQLLSLLAERDRKIAALSDDLLASQRRVIEMLGRR